MLYNTLSLIGEHLNNKNVIWAIGGPVMLKHFGLKDDPRNIEIFVDPKDIQCAVDIMNAIGELQIKESSDIFATTHYYKYHFGDVVVDVLSDMKIIHESGIYTYSFNINSIFEHLTINHIPIPVTTLEDWYLIYQLFEDGEELAGVIEAYFEENDIKHPEILKDQLNSNIPKMVKERIQNILDNPTYLLEQVRSLPKLDYASKKYAHHFKMMERAIKEFDKSFNNTVVDTNAFEHVIKSDEIVNAIYHYMYMPEFRMKNGLSGLKKAITKYALYEVEKMYKKNDHSLFNPEVYYDYIDRLIDRIQMMRDDELSLESIIQTKMIYDRISEMNALLTATLKGNNRE